MNRRHLEDRLQADAGRIQTNCPERVGTRVAARIRSQESRPSLWFLRLPALAGAAGAVALCAAIWLTGQSGGSDQQRLDGIALNAAPVVANSDRLLASREAALEQEWRLLGRDLRNLRDHVTATFDINPNG